VSENAINSNGIYINLKKEPMTRTNKYDNKFENNQASSVFVGPVQIKRGDKLGNKLQSK
jgi:hypothetical protein